MDRSVLGLIRQWLKAPVVEEGKSSPRKGNGKGTPQGGVLSPFLANVYLNCLDKLFSGPGGPGRFAGAKLVRYADDFVVLSRTGGQRIDRWLTHTLEHLMGLRVNREKTSRIWLKKPGESLDFLGYRFRYDRDRKGRPWRYLNVIASPDSLKRERAKIKRMTVPRLCFLPARDLIAVLNRQITGWSNYFKFGYPRTGYREINQYARKRLSRHLNRRSQRGYRKPKGVTWYKFCYKMGLVYL